MKTISIIIGISITVFSSFSYAGGVWTKYNNAQYIRDIAIEENYIWCATEGGVIKWNKIDGTHRIITTTDGLSDDFVTAVIVDKNGVKWFGTNNGVTKYSGTTFTTFTPLDGLSNRQVTTIAEDNKNNVWFGTVDGLSCFDGKKWITYKTEDGLVANGISAITVDSSNVVWVGTPRGLSSYDGKIWRTYTENDGLDVNNIISLAAGPDGVIWVGTWGGGGLSSFDGISWSNYDILHHTSSIDFDKNGLLWLGTYGRICSFDGATLTSFSDESQFVTEDNFVVAVDSVGIKWIGSQGHLDTGCAGRIGLSNFDGKIWVHYSINSLIYDYVHAVAVDHNDVKWFGTQCGISSFDGENWTNYTDRKGTDPTNAYVFSVYSIGVDKNNVKWFSTRWGSKRFDGKVWNTYSRNDSLSFNRFFHDIAIDYDNVKWFATVNGVWSFDDVSWKRYTVENGLVNNGVRAIAVDDDNIKWFGTEHGVSSFDGSKWTTYTEENGIPSNYVTSIAIDMDNKKWFGGGTIMNYDGTIWDEHQFDIRPFKSLCGGVQMAVDNKGVIWAVMSDICSGGGAIPGGIASYYGTTWTTYENTSTRWAGSAYDIAVDENNMKWFATLYGVYSYDDEKASVVSNTHKDSIDPIILNNFPNPFNPTTTIEFILPKTCFVDFIIYDIAGRKVSKLISDTLSKGFHSVIWNGVDDDGNKVSSGVYIYQLYAGDFILSNKMLLVR